MCPCMMWKLCGLCNNQQSSLVSGLVWPALSRNTRELMGCAHGRCMALAG